MPRLAANLTLMFNELAFLDRFQAAAGSGFAGVELQFPYAFSPAEIAAPLEATGLILTLLNLPPGDWDRGERGLAALPGREAEFRDGLAMALDYARALGCRRLHAMAGLTEQGARRETYVANLAEAAAAAEPHGIEILIEPINTIDMPGYFLSRTDDALDVIGEVGAPNLGLLLDLYHRQRMEGHVLEAIASAGSNARHFQIAAARDRGEPEVDGEIDFPAAFRAIDQSGYDGWVGCEYRPRGETRAGLRWVGDLGLSFG